jgi:hypothetical protein
MLFVVDRPRLLRMIAIVRDDTSPTRQGANARFLRLAARDGELSVSGEKASATFPATVYEPGVLFLRPTLFRRLVRTFAGEKFFTFQVTQEGLLFGDVRMPFEGSDMVYYPNPADAPDQWPPPPPAVEDIPAKAEPTLFPVEDPQ